MRLVVLNGGDISSSNDLTRFFIFPDIFVLLDTFSQGVCFGIAPGELSMFTDRTLLN